MKKILCVLLLAPLFFIRCYADGLYEQAGELTHAYQVENSLPGPGRAISGELKLDGSYDTQGALERLWGYVIETARDKLTLELRTAASLVLLAMLCALGGAFCESSEILLTLDRIGCCAAALLLSGSLNGLLAEATDSLLQLSDYSRAALPVLFMSAAAGGAVVSASARYAAACLAMEMMITASQRLIVPLIYAFLALAISQSLYENSILQAVMNLCKWSVTTALTVLTLAFGAYLSLTGLITGSADALAVKTARTVLSKSLPIVGGLLSDSASILLTAAAVVKNSVGVFALIAVCALCAGPLVLFSVKLLAYKAASAAVGFLPGTHLPKLIGDFGTAFGMLTGLIGCNAALLFISIVSGIRAVSPP